MILTLMIQMKVILDYTRRDYKSKYYKKLVHPGQDIQVQKIIQLDRHLQSVNE